MIFSCYNPTMSKLAVFFSVIAALAVLIDDVESQSLQGLDLQEFLQSLKQQLLNGKKSNDYLEVNNDEDDDEESHFGSLKDEQLGQLVALVRNSQDKVRQRPFIKNDRKITSSQLTKQILEQLSDQGKDKVLSQSRGNLGDVEARVELNDLLVPSRLLDNSNKYDQQLMENLELKDDSSDLSQYSKVYVILNADSVSSSKTRNNLKDLLARLVSGPRNENEQIWKKKEHRYKGFVVNDNYRTARRNREDDYADMDTPKKSRPSRGGSSWGKRGGGRGHGDLRSGYNRGGGSGGHTAIPYINHHVGVYERDD